MAAKQRNNKPKIKIPTKREINFAYIGVKGINWMIAIPSIVLIIVIAVLFSKFAVSDRFAKLSEKRAEANRLEQLQRDYYAQIQEYGNIDAEFAQYTYDGFTPEELELVSRTEVFDLLEKEIIAKADVSGWNINGNVVSLNVSGITLEEVSAMSKELKNNELVRYCMISTAQTNSNEIVDNSKPVTAVMTIYLQKKAEDEFLYPDAGYDEPYILQGGDQ